MDTSIFLARLIGPLCLVIGAGVAANRELYARMIDDFFDSPALVYLSGASALIVGLAIVLTHNVWSADWRVVLTLIGWGSILKGILRIVLPQRGRRLVKAFAKDGPALMAGMVFTLLLGGFLTYKGYFA